MNMHEPRVGIAARVARAFHPVTLAIALVGCSVSDPGWGYSVPNGKPAEGNELGFDLARDGNAFRVYGSLFAGTLDVEVDVRNEQGSTLEVDLDQLQIFDKRGQQLKRRLVSPTERCEGQRHGRVCALNRGQACRLAGRFNVVPLRSRFLFFREPNPDLQEVAVRVVSLRREGRESDAQFQLTRTH